MATRKSRSSGNSRNTSTGRTSRNSARETTARTTQGVDPARLQEVAQLSSQQHLALAAEAASTLLRTAEICGQVQLQALQRSGQTWREAAERLRTATSPLEFIGAQNQIMMDSMLQFLQLTQDLMRASAVANPAAAELAEEEASAANATASAAMQTPILQAWQAMVNPLGFAGVGALNGEASRAH